MKQGVEWWDRGGEGGLKQGWDRGEEGGIEAGG